MKRIYKTGLIVLAFLVSGSVAGEHPRLFFSKQEASDIKAGLGQYPLLDKSFKETVKMVDDAIGNPMDVPLPGEAGGYEHERHKQNYREMQAAGQLFVITGDEKYARFIRTMLMQYAEMYPTLGAHPLSHNQAAGRLFHQMLNETVWLVYVSQAYDCIYNWLSEKDRNQIESNIFKPIIEWFTVDKAQEFDRIHNHGTWSVASIGMLGYVLDDQNLVDMALYGTKKDGKGGFMKQLDMLFSPDGYYMEGPYYIRYALRPFFLFAEAVERNQPELKIYEYRDQILKKAYYSAVQTTYPNGIFPPINDASKTMNVEAVGVVIANDLTYYRYGADSNLLGVAMLQNRVILNAAGLQVAKDFTENKVQLPEWGSIEFTDGYNGQQGGLGILRTGNGAGQSMLLMKYGVHGEGHGHFDKLQFTFYNQEREIVPDYGFSRWINIEPKFGGRYLPENKSYAMQTIAHNTVTVDQKTQNNSDRDEADKVYGLRHFFDTSNPKVQVMSARANEHYPGVKMQRTMFLIEDDRLEYPVVVDLYRLESKDSHSYDYPVHFTGQMITTNANYSRFDSVQVPLGNDHGYQHIWKEAEADFSGPFNFTWLDGNRYYSLITSAVEQGKIFWGRSGAHDPNFNLRSEPLVLLRVPAKDYLFASVIEPHGFFNEAGEVSRDARSMIESVHVIGTNSHGSIIEISGKNDLKWRISVNNGQPSVSTAHSLKFNGHEYNWKGNFQVNLFAQ